MWQMDHAPGIAAEQLKGLPRRYTAMIAASIREKMAREAQYERAKAIAAQRASPPPRTPVDSHSATITEMGRGEP